MLIGIKSKRDAIKHLFYFLFFFSLFLSTKPVRAQEGIKLMPEIGFSYRHSYLQLVYGQDNLSMMMNSDKNIRGINGSLGFKALHFPSPKLSFRYRLHVRYDYLMHDIDYLNLMPSFGAEFIIFEKWGWLFDHRMSIYKTFKEKWDIGLGFTAFNYGKDNVQNLPPDNSQKWIYSIQINCLDFIVYRKVRNWFDFGLISSYTLNGLPDHKNGKYAIFELQLSRGFNFSKDK